MDLDALRQVWPAPPHDPFQHHLTVRNLTSWTHSALAAGAQRIAVAGVVESPTERGDYDAALRLPLQVVRLVAPAVVVQGRLRRRHREDHDGLAWHSRRAYELAAVRDRARTEDGQVGRQKGDAGTVARRVLAWAGWLPDRPAQS